MPRFINIGILTTRNSSHLHYVESEGSQPVEEPVQRSLVFERPTQHRPQLLRGHLDVTEVNKRLCRHKPTHSNLVLTRRHNYHHPRVAYPRPIPSEAVIWLSRRRSVG